MKSAFHYECALSYLKEYIEFEPNDNEDEFDIYLSPFADMPIPYAGNVFYSYNRINKDAELFDGVYYPLFSSTPVGYEIVNGQIQRKNVLFVAPNRRYVCSFEEKDLSDELIHKGMNGFIKEEVSKKIVEVYEY
jgi:hypothetical protein